MLAKGPTAMTSPTKSTAPSSLHRTSFYGILVLEGKTKTTRDISKRVPSLVIYG